MKHKLIVLLSLIAVLTQAQSYRISDNPEGYLKYQKHIKAGKQITILDSGIYKKTIKVDSYTALDGFKCIKRNSTFYTIKYKNKLYYIPTKDNRFKLLNWEEFILKMAAVNFDTNKITLHEKPNGKILPTLKDEIYIPRKIKGDWLMVEYGDDFNNRFAWIRWRKNGKLNIYPFHMA